MLTIGQLAAYAGVTVRAVRHYHQIGLLPEPERNASGYRTYGAPAVVALIKIRTLADAGVPLAQIGSMLEADPATFAEAVERIDTRLSDEIDRLRASREQVARLAAGDSLVLPPEVVAYLDRLREIGTSERMIAGERDGWILMTARWPGSVHEWIPDKVAQLEDPRVVRLYQVLSALMETGGTDDDPLLPEAVDIMVELAEQAEAAGQLDLAEAGRDETFFALLDDLADTADKRAERMRELMRERGWDGWIRMQRL
jgi:DNA-binding transcriptional MerR regulator